MDMTPGTPVFRVDLTGVSVGMGTPEVVGEMGMSFTTAVAADPEKN